MRGKSHKHLHAAHMHRAKGGKVEVDREEANEGGGDPAVEREAEEKKRGGKVKRKAGGKVDGKKPHHRMDRPAPGRKHGGRVGADRAPLSSAHSTTSPEPRPKSQEGGMSK